MGQVYTLVNQKGGVGKTTTAINLGAYLAYYGQRVLLVDLDPQANATSSLKIDKNTVRGGTYEALIGKSVAGNYILHNPRLKLSLLPSSPALAGAEVELVNELARESRLKNALTEIVARYDYILIDCPPSLGLLTLNGLVAAFNGVIIPVQCEYLALEGLGQLTQTITKVRMMDAPTWQMTSWRRYSAIFQIWFSNPSSPVVFASLKRHRMASRSPSTRPTQAAPKLTPRWREKSWLEMACKFLLCFRSENAQKIRTWPWP